MSIENISNINTSDKSDEVLFINSTDHLKINSTEDNIQYSFKLNLLNKELSEIIKNTISVDKEYNSNITRNISICSDGNITFDYSSKAIYLKPMKKSINSLMDSISLILETVNQFYE